MEKKYLIKNQNISLTIARLGGEVREFIFNGVNYIHNDFALWQQTSPHLFPIVGRLKEGYYNLYDQNYHLNGHGFVRDQEFNVVKKDANRITLSLSANENLMTKYPFNFNYQITYKLLKNGLETIIKIKNNGKKKMFFNIGEHPGFKLFSSPTNYQVIFNKTETFVSPSITVDKLLDFNNKTTYFKHLKKLVLNDDLFENDALINTNVKSNKVSIISPDYCLEYTFKKFKTFALWKKPGASFICLEPWNGHADIKETNNDFLSKPQLITLKPNKSKIFKTRFTIIKEKI